jgi:hypothetical protein
MAAGTALRGNRPVDPLPVTNSHLGICPAGNMQVSGLRFFS